MTNCPEFLSGFQLRVGKPAIDATDTAKMGPIIQGKGEFKALKTSAARRASVKVPSLSRTLATPCASRQNPQPH